MKQKFVIISSVVILFSAFWFLCVDESIFVKSCPDCDYGEDVYQIRIFTIPIYQHTEQHDSILQKIALDLGAECKHPNMSAGYQKWRFWGLLIPDEIHLGIDSLSGGDDWYDDKARAIVKEMVKANPSLRDEFANRVLKNHDWKYLKTFVQKVIALKDEKPIPASRQ
ncbi:MAG TPA: hypothetical protein VHG71_00630 [Verrucomicrobiae bacterium]|nr:hypothetical protein [Verrucomicrobiae bacterium]